MPSPSLLEKIAVTDAKAIAAHARLDRTEQLINDELKSIKSNFSLMAAEVKELVALANRAKGWMAAATLFGVLLGGLITRIASKWIE